MTASACTASGGGLKWRSPALAGGVRSVIRLPNTIVALGPKIAYFLDPTSGALIGAAITPTGSLEFSHVLPGADGSITLLSQSPTEAGIKEVVLFDAPGKEAARYVTGSTGYVVDLDARGQALLLGADLVRLLPASEYRKVR